MSIQPSGAFVKNKAGENNDFSHCGSCIRERNMIVLCKSFEHEVMSVSCTVSFARLREDAILPSKREEDSDYDLYACFDAEELVIPPLSTEFIPTGLISAFPKEYGIKLEERGSNAKWCGIVQAGVIDSGYRGEWIVAMYNGNSVPVHITKAVDKVERRADAVLVPYTKAICQFHVRRIEKAELRELSAEEVLAVRSERGAGKLGSSGK